MQNNICVRLHDTFSQLLSLINKIVSIYVINLISFNFTFKFFDIILKNAYLISEIFLNSTIAN